MVGTCGIKFRALDRFNTSMHHLVYLMEKLVIMYDWINKTSHKIAGWNLGGHMFYCCSMVILGNHRQQQ